MLLNGTALYLSLVAQVSQHWNKLGANTNETRAANCHSSTPTTSPAVLQDIVRHGKQRVSVPEASHEEYGLLQAVAAKRSLLSSSVSALTQQLLWDEITALKGALQEEKELNAKRHADLLALLTALQPKPPTP